jgi:hypothetical protein
MRMAGLRRRGFAEAGAVWVDNRDDAELRFALELPADENSVPDTPPNPAKPATLRPGPSVPAIGLVSFQGRR